MPTISGLSDAMSDVLALVRMRGEMVCASECSAPWSLGFASHASHFHIVERGIAYVTLDDGRVVRLEAGDLAIIPLGTGHTLSSDSKLAPVPIDEAMHDSGASDGLVLRIGGGGEQTEVVCGRFYFSGVLAPKLLTVLPRVIHIEGRQGRPLEWLRLTTHFLIDETRNPRPGSAIMIARLLDLMFIQAIREWGARSPLNLGWLSGLKDPQIGRALSAIHEDPALKWSVEGLAARAGLSRSAFAARFLDVVGQTPLKYLATWRLDLAADLLRGGTARIADIAATVGYGSEAALTRAFKSQFGSTPAVFRRAGEED